MNPLRRSSYVIIGDAEHESRTSNDQDSYDYDQDDMVADVHTAADARAQAQQRLYGDRVRTAIALGALLVLTLSSIMLGMNVEQHRGLASYRGRGLVVLALSDIMAALMEEAAHSVSFTDPDMSVNAADDGLTDRERAARLTRLQVATRTAFEVAVGSQQQRCPTCESIMSAYNFADLMLVQRQVMMRTMGPAEVYQYYSGGLLRLAGVIAAFAGWGVEGGMNSVEWAAQLLLASRGLSLTASAWLDAHKTQDLTLGMRFVYMAMGAGAVDLVEALSPMMRLHPAREGGDGVSEREIRDAVDEARSAVRSLLRNATAPIGDLQSVGPTPPRETIALLLERYRAFIGAVAAEEPWDRGSVSDWQWIIGLSAAMIAVSIVVVVIPLREATVLVWAADAELAQMKATHRLETSLERMYQFVDALYRLDRVRIAESVARCTASGPSATNVERALLQLAAPARHALSYVNPCVLDRCRAAYEAHSGGAPVAKGAYGEEVGPIVMGLRLQYVSLVMVDLRCFANADITAETGPTLTKELLVFLNDMSALVARCGGTLLGISGTVLTIAWNVRTNGGGSHGEDGGDGGGEGELLRRGQRAGGLRATDGPGPAVGVGADGTSDSPVNDACQMLFRFRLTKLQHKYPKVRFSVISGVCKQGVVGSPRTQAYVVMGNLVMLGRLLLEGARLHDVSFVSDTSTLLKLDTQQFRKRALEVMGLYAASNSEVDLPAGERPPTVGSFVARGPAPRWDVNSPAFSVARTTVVYELTITGVETNDYALLWNAAFDDFFTGKVEDAMRKLMAWRRLVGDRPSIRRVMQIIGEVGGYKGPVYYHPDGTRGFEYNLLL